MEIPTYKIWQTPDLLGWDRLSEGPPGWLIKTPHNWTPEPTNFSDHLFDQDFDESMESIDNLEPFDDLAD